MSRAEHDAMVGDGRVQPTTGGLHMKHVTVPPNSDAFRAAVPGSVFVEFDIIDAQTSAGGKEGWLIVYGPNSPLGRLAAGKGLTVVGLPRAENVIITETK